MAERVFFLTEAESVRFRRIVYIYRYIDRQINFLVYRYIDRQIDFLVYRYIDRQIDFLVIFSIFLSSFSSVHST